MATPAPFPDWLEPMAATLTQERFTDPDWLFERKLDGIRLLAYKRGDDVRLFSRNGLQRVMPRVADAIRRLPVHDAIFDGEAAWEAGSKVAYHIFDLLWLDGRDLTRLPLVERYALLDRIPFRPPIGRVGQLTDPEPWTRACAEGWEGVIAKRRDSVYEHRRSRNWLKMKCEVVQDLVVGGFTEPQRSRVGLGALIVGYYDGDDFVYAGKVGTGFDTKLLLELSARLATIEISAPPFTHAVGLPRIRAHWVRPEIVVHVAFTEWTVHGKLRHSRLLGIREDMDPRDVRRESA